MANEPSNATEGPRWLPRAERFVRRALLAELAFVDLHREGFFYPSLGNSEEMINSTFPFTIGTFFTQTHSPESRAPGRRPCEEAVGRLSDISPSTHRVAFFRLPSHRRMTEDWQIYRYSIEATVALVPPDRGPVFRASLICSSSSWPKRSSSAKSSSFWDRRFRTRYDLGSVGHVSDKTPRFAPNRPGIVPLTSSSRAT